MIELNLALRKTNDIQVINVDNPVKLQDVLNTLRDLDSVWLATNGKDGGEIIVTESIDLITQLLGIEVFNMLWELDYKFFVQEYATFESAYSVALMMREVQPNCYDEDNDSDVNYKFN